MRQFHLLLVSLVEKSINYVSVVYLQTVITTLRDRLDQ